MKFTFTSALTSLALFVFSYSGMAADCPPLKDPIQVGTASLLDKGVVIKNVKFDAIPKFDGSTAFDPANDKMDFSLFNIRFGSFPMQDLGGRISVSGKLIDAGFADAYEGNYNIQGGYKNENGLVTYKTTRAEKDDKTGKDTVTELQVVVNQGAITSLRLTFPVYKVTSQNGNTVNVAFTGENQTVCLVSGN